MRVWVQRILVSVRGQLSACGELRRAVSVAGELSGCGAGFQLELDSVYREGREEREENGVPSRRAVVPFLDSSRSSRPSRLNLPGIDRIGQVYLEGELFELHGQVDAVDGDGLGDA